MISAKFLLRRWTEADPTVKQNRAVALLSTLFLALLVLFYLPAVIFHQHSLSLDGAFFEYVLLSLGVLVAVSVAAFFAFLTLPGHLIRAAALTISFVALSSFVMSAFITPLTVDIGLLDGTRQALAVHYLPATLEIALGLALLGMLSLLYDRGRPFLRDMLVLSNLLIVGYTGYVTAADASTDAGNSDTSVSSVHDFMRFSEHENILLVLLDTLSSDYLLALLDENPLLAQQLDGFTFFRDAASVSPTTYMAMPSIHSGRYVAPDQPFRKAYDELVGRKSFLSSIASEGAEVYLLNTIFTCPDGVECLTSPGILAVSHEAIVQDWYLLIDIALFRILPHAMKSLIYNDGDWYFSRAHREDNPIQVESFRDNRVLHEIADNLYVEGKEPQVRFVHLFNAHYPFNVGRSCELVAADSESLTLALNGARCAIGGLVAVLDALKKNDIYDSALIAVFADHGSHLEYVGRANADQIDVDESLRFELRRVSRNRSRSLPRVPNKAHPVFLVKRPGDKGRMELDTEHAVSLTDIPATVCAYSARCAVSDGIDVFEAPEASSRERLYNDYIWKPEFWGADNLEDDLKRIVIDYSVLEGNVYDRVPGEAFFFNQEGFRFRGFGPAEGWGRRSDGLGSELKLCFAVPPVSPLELVMESRVFVTDQGRGQRIVVRIAGESVMEETFENAQADGADQELRAVLQPDHVDESGCAVISFAFPDAVPQDERTRNDQSGLVLGLISLRFE